MTQTNSVNLSDHHNVGLDMYSLTTFWLESDFLAPHSLLLELATFLRKAAAAVQQFKISLQKYSKIV